MRIGITNVLVGVSLLAVSGNVSAAAYKVGDAVKDFALKDTAGKTVKLSQFKDKVIVLAFSASFWGSCNAEAPRLEKEIWQKYNAQGVQVIGINAGDPERKAKAFKAQHKLSFPYLLDREQTVIDQFSAEGALPHIVIIGKDFTLKYSEAGGTVEDLLAKLDEVLTGKATADKPTAAVAQNRPKLAFLGAETRAPTREEVTRYGLKGVVGKPNGQVVTDVQKDGPAERAGVRKSDILLRLDANDIFSRDDSDDFVRVSKPGATVKALIKRDGKELELALALGERTLNDQEAKAPLFVWDFAGPAQLEAALKQAKKEGKSVLIGLSGAETWWPTTRFEDSSSSQIFTDSRVVSEAKNFVKVIVRRPLAYSFRQRFPQAAIPGLLFLDSEGKSKGGLALAAADAKAVAETMRKLR